MGSLPKGTLCSYCGVREAGYIPDGAAGPIGFEPDGECCWDSGVALGWDVMVQERQMRLVGSENSSGTASSTAAEQQGVAANGAPTPIPTDAGQPSVSASVANKSTVAASGASIAIQQALGISAEEPRTKRQNNGSSAYQGPTCFQIAAVDFYGAQCTARGWHRAIHQVNNILHNDWRVVESETSDVGVYMRRLAEGQTGGSAITINYPDREPNKYSPIFDTASVACRTPSLDPGFPTRPFNWGVDIVFFQDVSRVPLRQTNLVVRCVRQSVVYGNNAVARD